MSLYRNMLATLTLSATLAGSAAWGDEQPQQQERPERGPRGIGRQFNADEIFTRFDKNKDGKIAKDEVEERAWGFLTRGMKEGTESFTKEQLLEARKNLPTPEQQAEERFNAQDKNKDGKLTKDEVNERAWQFYSRADENKDGAVTKEELKAAREKFRQERQNRGENPERPRRPRQNDDSVLFDEPSEDKAEDKADEPRRDRRRFDRRRGNEERGERRERGNNERGERPERPNPEEMFNKWFDNADTNDDGLLSKDELKANREKMREQFRNRFPQRRPGAERPERGRERPRGNDEPRPERPRNNDDDNNRPERPRGERPRGERPDPRAFFDNADKNDDGKLTKDELPERAWEFFSRADENKDGSVTWEELESHREKRMEEFRNRQREGNERGPREGRERRGPRRERSEDNNENDT